MKNKLNEKIKAKYPHLEISVLKLSEVKKDNEKDRIDAEFFGKNFVKTYNQIQSQDFIFLKDCLQVLTDYHANGSYETLHANVEILDDKNYAYMARSTDFEKMDFDNDVKYITKHAYSFLEKTKIFGGEVLINKIGSPGTTYFMPHLNKPVSLGMNLFLLRTNEKLSSSFLYVFLNTKIGKIIISRKISGAVPPTIDKEAIKTLPIPLLPKEFQLEIEKLVKDSHAALESSKALYKEAEALLYAELGIENNNMQNVDCRDLTKDSVDCREFANANSRNDSNPSMTTTSSLRVSEASEAIHSLESKYPHLNISIKSLKDSLQTTGRLDAEYYQSKYEDNENLIKAQYYEKLGDLVEIKKSIEPGSQSYTDSGVSFVRVSNLGKFGISQSEIYINPAEFKSDILKALYPKKDNILLSKDGSVAIAFCMQEDGDFITSGAILHLQVKDAKKILPQYLTLTLNSITTRLQADRDCGGSIISHWRLEDINNVLIPILDFKIQEKIALKIQKSFELHAQSKELLELAKAKVENAIESIKADSIDYKDSKHL